MAQQQMCAHFSTFSLHCTALASATLPLNVISLSLSSYSYSASHTYLRPLAGKRKRASVFANRLGTIKTAAAKHQRQQQPANSSQLTAASQAARHCIAPLWRLCEIELHYSPPFAQHQHRGHKTGAQLDGRPVSRTIVMAVL